MLEFKIKLLEKNITQKEIAKELNVSENTISRWVNNNLGNIDKFIDFCNILDIDPRDIKKNN